MVTVDGRPVEVVGVMPAAFRFPDETTGMWKPILLDAEGAEREQPRLARLHDPGASEGAA